MADATSRELPGRGVDRIRRMDHLEASVLAQPKRISGAGRAGVHDSVRPSSHHLHPVRAWAILAYITLCTGATSAAFYIQWKWG